jgi:hypothetical protein
MAKIKVKDKLALSGSELCFAGQVNGTPQLLLPKDPFQGYLVEDIAQELQKAKEQLIEKGWLTKDKEGQQTLTPELKKAIEILGSPDRSLILQQEYQDGNSNVVYFHQKGKDWIELRMLDEDHYQAEKIQSKKALQERLKEVFELKMGEKDPEKSVQLKYEDYFLAQEIAREKGLSASKKYLEKVGLDTAVVEKLAEDLSKPVTSGSATQWSWKEKEVQTQKGLAFLGGMERLWLILETQHKPDWFDMTLSTAEEIQKEILKL